MFGIGLPEIIVIGIVGVILFGRNLPDVARSLGKGAREFQKGLHEVKDEINQLDVKQPEVKKDDQP